MYIIERVFNTKDKMVAENRISGDISKQDFDYAKKCMEFRFQDKVIEYRHQVINGGSVEYTDTKCTMYLNVGRYEISIVEA